MRNAIYELEVKVVFAGPLPEHHNRAAPEIADAHHAAVEALQATLGDHGYALVRTGHGSRRVDRPGDLCGCIFVDACDRGDGCRVLAGTIPDENGGVQ